MFIVWEKYNGGCEKPARISIACGMGMGGERSAVSIFAATRTAGGRYLSLPRGFSERIGAAQGDASPLRKATVPGDFRGAVRDHGGVPFRFFHQPGARSFRAHHPRAGKPPVVVLGQRAPLPPSRPRLASRAGRRLGSHHHRHAALLRRAGRGGEKLGAGFLAAHRVDQWIAATLVLLAFPLLVLERWLSDLPARVGTERQVPTYLLRLLLFTLLGQALAHVLLWYSLPFAIVV